MNKVVKDIKDIQEELKQRTEIENIAIKLISECKFEDAIEILKTI